MWSIKCWVRSHKDSEDDVICEMVKDVKEKINKYWEEFSDILEILDYRLKFAFLENCYNIPDPATTKLNLDYVGGKMLKLFGAYKRDLSLIRVSTSHVSKCNIPSGYDVSLYYIV